MDARTLRCRQRYKRAHGKDELHSSGPGIREAQRSAGPTTTTVGAAEVAAMLAWPLSTRLARDRRLCADAARLVRVLQVFRGGGAVPRRVATGGSCHRLRWLWHPLPVRLVLLAGRALDPPGPGQSVPPRERVAHRERAAVGGGGSAARTSGLCVVGIAAAAARRGGGAAAGALPRAPLDCSARRGVGGRHRGGGSLPLHLGAEVHAAQVRAQSVALVWVYARVAGVRRTAAARA